MPVDPTAKKRAFVLCCVGTAIVIGLPAIYYWNGWMFAFVLPTGLLLWSVPAAYERKRTIDLLKPSLSALFARADDDNAFPVVVTVRRGIWSIGIDVGLLRFVDHRINFEGTRADFNLHRRDIEDGIDGTGFVVHGVDGIGLDLAVQLSLSWPNGVADTSRRGDIYLNEFDNFSRSAKTKAGDSQLPPRLPFAVNELRVHQPFFLGNLAWMPPQLAYIVTMFMGLGWRAVLTVGSIAYVIGCIGLWLYLRRAYKIAIASLYHDIAVEGGQVTRA